MEPLILLLGLILGFIIVILQGNGSKPRKQTPQIRPPARNRDFIRPISAGINTNPWLTFVNSQSYNPLDRYSRYICRRMPAERIPESRRQKARIMEENTRTIVEKWRKSIVGLIRLADSHLAVAKSYLDRGNYTSTVQDASASVENIARALIHCYGGKPDIDPNQEEVLKMLSRRFCGDEKAEFERAIDIVANVGYNRIILRHLSTPETQVWLFGETQAKQILKSASNIVALFKRIITEHFASEIPELGEACPKCHSLLVSIWGFGTENVTCECNICHNKWIAPRA